MKTSQRRSPGNWAKLVVLTSVALFMLTAAWSWLSLRAQTAAAQDAATISRNPQAESASTGLVAQQGSTSNQANGTSSSRIAADGSLLPSPFGVTSSGRQSVGGVTQGNQWPITSFSQSGQPSSVYSTQSVQNPFGYSVGRRVGINQSQQQTGFAGDMGMLQSSIGYRTKADMEFDVKTRNLVNMLRTAEDDDKRDELEEQLEDLLEAHFDERMEARENELKQIEERVNRLRDELDRRVDARDEIIELRLKTLINEANGLGF